MYIYVISKIGDVNSMIYVGSTLLVEQRRSEHRRASEKAKEDSVDIQYLYDYINEHGGWSNFMMIWVEHLANTDRVSVAVAESFWMISYGDRCINKAIPIYNVKVPKDIGYPDAIVDRRIADVFPFDLEVSKMGYSSSGLRICKCGEEFDDFDIHTKDGEGHLEFMSELSVNCQCGVEYYYSNQYHHFKTFEHRKWYRENPKGYDDVRIICRCGEIIRYGDRTEHNSSHFVKFG